MKTPHITFLGPIGATFSHDAYVALAGIYGAPAVTTENYIEAKNNGEVLRLIAKHEGYGAIAMETLAGGRVAEPLEAFIETLQSPECTFHIVGAVQMKLHFCLMVRQDNEEITSVIAHPKALEACKGKIELPTLNASSNGEAARLVAESEEHKSCAALGPRSAAEKYGLKVLDEAFEDKEAITTFFLITPKEHKVAVGKKNRALIVYKTPHKPGALVDSLLPFKTEGLNMIQIHSVHAGNGVYHFAIEVEVGENEMDKWQRAMESFESCVEKHFTFGPFEVLSR
ncbi:MAG: prephenate dehydratase domain-containing protein [bacterium]